VKIQIYADLGCMDKYSIINQSIKLAMVKALYCEFGNSLKICRLADPTTLILTFLNLKSTGFDQLSRTTVVPILSHIPISGFCFTVLTYKT